MPRRSFLKFALTGGILVSAYSMPALAKPPDPGTPASDELAPYGPAISKLISPIGTTICCDLSDCRRAAIEITADGHYRAFIAHRDPKTGQGFVGGIDDWLDVPDEIIIPLEKRAPTPFSLACWTRERYDLKYLRGFFCFNPGEGS